MSGGAYDYFYERDTAEDILEHRSDLEQMVATCKAHDKKEAFRLLNDLYLDLEYMATVIEQKHEKLNKIMHDLEWWQSGDTGEEDFDKTVDEFMSRKK